MSNKKSTKNKIGSRLEFIKVFVVFLSVFLFFSCVKDKNFDAPQANCSLDIVANTTIGAVKKLYINETIQIQEDLIIEGYVISSDKAGNFFSVLHFQDKPMNPTEGFQIELDVRDTHLFYPVGSKILIRVKGLYLGKSNGIFKIGGVFTAFGNQSVGRLPAAIVSEHIFTSCDEIITLEPLVTTIENSIKVPTNVLVQINDVEIIWDEIGETFAIEREETERRLIDCIDNELLLINSGFSDFQEEFLPTNSGNITGVFLKGEDDFNLIIRGLEDINFNKERCEDFIDEFTSTEIFISELADPDNNIGARFVEIYNSGSADLPLKGWSLRRYTNENVEVSSVLDFTDEVIKSGGTIIISPNAEEFGIVYGFAPDIAVGTNSPADSNGDDNLELVNPFGTIIDVFGIIGQDGTGTNHEFEDGRAFRNSSIFMANPNYSFQEWIIYNDTGAANTINLPQNAPDDFTPGDRN